MDKNIKNAVIAKDFKECDLYERFILNDLINKGYTAEKAIDLIINSAEGDYSQLSEAIKKYIK